MSDVERARASIVPMLILVMPILALASGFVFAVDSLDAPVPLALLGALGWSVIVFVINRAIVLAPRRPTAMLIGRFLLAIAIGFLVAEPLVARLFASDVDAQVEIMREATTQSGLADLAANPRYGDAALTAARKRLDDARTGSTSPRDAQADISADPKVTRLRAALSEIEQRRAELRDQIECELDGTCGAGIRGDGDVVRQRRRELQRLDAEETSLRDQLTAAEQAAATPRLDTQHAEIAQFEQELSALTAERRAADRTVGGGGEGGLAASIAERYDALSQVRAGNLSVNVRFWLIATLLILISVLPIVIVTFVPPVTNDVPHAPRRSTSRR